MNDKVKTPEELAEENRRDVLAFAVREADGKLYRLNEKGEREIAPEGTPELTPEYKKVMDQTAAIMVLYNKVEAMSEAERGVLATIISTAKKPFQGMAGATDKVRDAANEFNKIRKENGLTLPGEQTLGTVSDVAGGVVDGISAPYTLLHDLIVNGKNVIGQIGGTETAVENAKSIGLAYASAAQAAAQSHTGFKFTEWASWTSYFQAILKFATSWVCDKFGWDKNYELGWHKKGSFKELVADEYRDNDLPRIEKELTKLDEIGDTKTEKLRFLAREKSEVQTQSGATVTIVGADSKHAAPEIEGFKELNTAEAAAKSDMAAGNGATRMGNALANSQFSAVDKFKEASTAGKVATIAAGTVVTAYTAKSVTEGVAQHMVGKNSGLAKAGDQLAEQATKTGNKALEQRVGKDYKIYKTKPNMAKAEEGLAKANTIRKEADALHDAAEARNASFGSKTMGGKTMVEIAETSEVTGWSKLNPLKWPKMGLQATGRMLANACDLSVPVTSGPLLASRSNLLNAMNPLNWPKAAIHVVGRKYGAITGAFSEGAAATTAATAEGASATATVASAAGKAPLFERMGVSLGKGLAWCGDKIGVGGGAKVAAEGATVVAEGATVAAESASIWSKGLSCLGIGGKLLGRASPYIAPVIATGSLVYGYSKHDERTVNKAWWEVGTIGTCVAGGAALGLAGGPFAPITCTAGALGGLIVGGIASIFTGAAADKHYVNNHTAESAGAAVASLVVPPTAPKAPAAPATATPQMDPGLAVAAQDQYKSAMERAKLASARAGQMLAVTSTKIGATHSELPASPPKAAGAATGPVQIIGA